jgi:hypothetical protein
MLLVIEGEGKDIGKLDGIAVSQQEPAFAADFGAVNFSAVGTSAVLDVALAIFAVEP